MTCWRGHDPKRRNKFRQCMDCHAIHMRMKRVGRQARKMPHYRLNVTLFRKCAKGRMRIVAQLSGLSFYSMQMWLYRGIRARPEHAQALAQGMRIPFNQLWECVNS